MYTHKNPDHAIILHQSKVTVLNTVLVRFSTGMVSGSVHINPDHGCFLHQSEVRVLKQCWYQVSFPVGRLSGSAMNIEIADTIADDFVIQSF